MRICARVQCALAGLQLPSNLGSYNLSPPATLSFVSNPNFIYTAGAPLAAMPTLPPLSGLNKTCAAPIALPPSAPTSPSINLVISAQFLDDNVAAAKDLLSKAIQVAQVRRLQKHTITLSIETEFAVKL